VESSVQAWVAAADVEAATRRFCDALLEGWRLVGVWREMRWGPAPVPPKAEEESRGARAQGGTPPGAGGACTPAGRPWRAASARPDPPPRTCPQRLLTLVPPAAPPRTLPRPPAAPCPAAALHIARDNPSPLLGATARAEPRNELARSIAAPPGLYPRAQPPLPIASSLNLINCWTHWVRPSTNRGLKP